MNEANRESLSPAIVQRRESMLEALTAEMMQLHRARRRRRAALASSAMSLALIAAIAGAMRWASLPIRDTALQQTHDRLATSRPNDPAASASPERLSPAVIIARVQTDPTILDRFRPQPTVQVTILDDDALIRELEAINRPAGIIRIGRQVRLTHAVADPIDRALRRLPDGSSMLSAPHYPAGL